MDTRTRGDVGTDHGSGPGSYVGRADVFTVHVLAMGDHHVVPVEEAPRGKMSLRLRPAGNNQRAGVRRAEDYRLDRWAAAHCRSPFPSEGAPRVAA